MADRNLDDAIDAAIEIEENGRQIILQTPNTTSGTGPVFDRNRNNDQGEPTEEVIWAVATNFENELVDGAIIRTTDQQFLISGLHTVNQSMKIVDGSKTYNILNIESLRPADVAIIHTLHCR